MKQLVLFQPNQMMALAIGTSTGLVVVLVMILLRKLDKPAIYGLILSGIGFLYVGFTWTNTLSLAINIIQAIVFIFIAYYGLRKNLSFMIVGYFLHGSWDLVYGHLHLPDLLPPHYDLFCWSIDFVIGAYLVVLKYRLTRLQLPEGSESLATGR